MVGSTTRGVVEDVEEEEEVLDWQARELDDCLSEGDKLKCGLVRSLKARKDKCVHPALPKLANCLDLPRILQSVCGSSSSTGKPYDEVSLMLHGAEEFEELILHLQSTPHLACEKDLTFHRVMSSRIHDNIKNGIASTVWGDHFSCVGSKMFVISEGEDKGKPLHEVFDAEHAFVEKFSIAESSHNFTLEPEYFIKVSSKERNYRVKFVKSQLWESLYTEESLYKMIGREGCVALDYAFNIGGSEAIAETYFGVMKSQLKDNHDPETADMRSLVKYCLPDPSHCPNAVEKIAKIYREGDLKNRVKRHRPNIFFDKRRRASTKYKVSKAVDNFRNKKVGVSYIS